MATSVNKVTGEVLSKETEEEASIKDELVAAVFANAPPSDAGGIKQTHRRQKVNYVYCF